MAKSCSVNRYCVMLMHSTMLLFGLLIMANLKPTGAEVGVCYGMIGDNLPSPTEVIALFQQKNIPRMRLYAPNEAAFQALGGTAIKLLLDVPNSDLETIAASQGNAVQWVQDNIVKYSNVNFQYIAVGNEAMPSDSFEQFLLPAMQNIRKAIVAAGLGDRIKVSTATSVAAIESSFPPSTGNFSYDYRQLLGPVIDFLKDNQAPILVNIYPYFTYTGNPEQISLEYALFTSPSTLSDGPLQYQNLFDAMVDAFYSALEKAGGESLNIVVSESGWPSKGGVAASVDNARVYNTKLVEHVNQGTPKKPGPIETYIFAMFDERNKQGDETERHWGLFYPDKQEKYEISFCSISSNKNRVIKVTFC